MELFCAPIVSTIETDCRVARTLHGRDCLNVLSLPRCLDTRLHVALRAMGSLVEALRMRDRAGVVGAEPPTSFRSGSGALFVASPGKHVRHRVVGLVAGEFVELLVCPHKGELAREGPRPMGRVLDRETVVDGVFVHPSEALDDAQRIVGPAVRGARFDFVVALGAPLALARPLNRPSMRSRRRRNSGWTQPAPRANRSRTRAIAQRSTKLAEICALRFFCRHVLQPRDVREALPYPEAAAPFADHAQSRRHNNAPPGLCRTTLHLPGCFTGNRTKGQGREGHFFAAGFQFISSVIESLPSPLIVPAAANDARVKKHHRHTGGWQCNRRWSARDGPRSTLAARVSQELRLALGLTVPVRLVQEGTLPRFEMKARRFVLEE